MGRKGQTQGDRAVAAGLMTLEAFHALQWQSSSTSGGSAPQASCSADESATVLDSSWVWGGLSADVSPLWKARASASSDAMVQGKGTTQIAAQMRPERQAGTFRPASSRLQSSETIGGRASAFYRDGHIAHRPAAGLPCHLPGHRL